MKKVLFILMACAIAVSFGAPAMAKQGLSAGIGFGLLGNAGQLGGTICDDGLTQDIGGLSGANPYTNSFMDTITLVEAEDSLTDQEGDGDISSLSTSGAMSALDIQLQVRYDFLGYLFARTGINYAMKLSGGETSWKVAGVKQSQEWDYSHMIIPVTVGLNLPIGEKFNAYMGLTMAYVSGGWSVDLSRSATINSASGYGAAGLNQAITLVDGGRATEKVEFEVSGMSFGYVLGFSAEVYENVNVFVELETMVLADYDTHKVGDAGLVAAGLTQFTKYTVVGGNFLRFGATYNFGFATI